MMKWEGAGALLMLALLGLAGCLPSALVPQPRKAEPMPDEIVLAANLDWVAFTSESLLRKQHIQFVSEPAADGMHIQATTEKGGRFSLHLTRVASGAEPFTRVRFEWEGGAPEPVHVLLFATLDAMAPS